MKINCQEGFRCREHCQDHCYDQDGVLWEDHYMFCGEDEQRESIRGINFMNTSIFKMVVLTVALLLTSSVQAGIFGSSKASKLKNTIATIKNDHQQSLTTILELQARIADLNEINICMKKALAIAEQDLTLSQTQLIALRTENETLQRMIKDHGDAFDANITALKDVTAKLEGLNQDLDEALVE